MSLASTFGRDVVVVEVRAVLRVVLGDVALEVVDLEVVVVFAFKSCCNKIRSSTEFDKVDLALVVVRKVVVDRIVDGRDVVVDVVVAVATSQFCVRTLSLELELFVVKD